MRLDNDLDELSPSRLFIHRRLNDPMTGGPLYCRIRAFEGDLVEYETIYHREDGSERIGSAHQLPLEGFLELSFGRWYEGSSAPPAAPRRPRGQPVPLDPRKIRGRPAGS
jgi:hypothetical protein